LFPIKAENNPWPQTAANNEKINREPKGVLKKEVVKATLSRTSAWSTIGTSRRSTSSHWKLYPSSHTNRPETHQPQTIQIPNLPYIHNKIITTKHFLKKKKKNLPNISWLFPASYCGLQLKKRGGSGKSKKKLMWAWQSIRSVDPSNQRRANKKKWVFVVFAFLAL